MTDRREFLGAMLALFCGVALPPMVRESVRVHRPDGLLGVLHEDVLSPFARVEMSSYDEWRFRNGTYVYSGWSEHTPQGVSRGFSEGFYP